MNESFAYALLLAGVPVFVGMFVGSFIVLPVSKISQRSIGIQRALQRTQVQLIEAISGLVAAIAGAFLFRLCGPIPTLIVPAILAAWVSIYCLATHQSVPKWLSWLGGLIIGWFALATTIIGA